MVILAFPFVLLYFAALGLAMLVIAAVYVAYWTLVVTVAVAAFGYQLLRALVVGVPKGHHRARQVRQEAEEDVRRYSDRR